MMDSDLVCDYLIIRCNSAEVEPLFMLKFHLKDIKDCGNVVYRLTPMC